MLRRACDGAASRASLQFTVKTFEPQTIVTARFMPDGQSDRLQRGADRQRRPACSRFASGTLEARAFGPPRTHLLSVSSKGELAVLTDARLIGQRLFKGTLARMSIEGSPRPWMEDVREADWSPDGSTLAIVHDVGRRIGSSIRSAPCSTKRPATSAIRASRRMARASRSWIIKRDSTIAAGSRWSMRSGKVTTLAGEFWGEEGLAWSRDGATVFFAANDRQASDEGRPGDVTYQMHSVAVDRPGTVRLRADQPRRLHDSRHRAGRTMARDAGGHSPRRRRSSRWRNN